MREQLGTREDPLPCLSITIDYEPAPEEAAGEHEHELLQTPSEFIYGASIWALYLNSSGRLEFRRKDASSKANRESPTTGNDFSEPVQV